MLSASTFTASNFTRYCSLSLSLLCLPSQLYSLSISPISPITDIFPPSLLYLPSHPNFFSTWFSIFITHGVLSPSFICFFLSGYIHPPSFLRLQSSSLHHPSIYKHSFSVTCIVVESPRFPAVPALPRRFILIANGAATSYPAPHLTDHAKPAIASSLHPHTVSLTVPHLLPPSTPTPTLTESHHSPTPHYSLCHTPSTSPHLHVTESVTSDTSSYTPTHTVPTVSVSHFPLANPHPHVTNQATTTSFMSPTHH